MDNCQVMDAEETRSSTSSPSQSQTKNMKTENQPPPQDKEEEEEEEEEKVKKEEEEKKRNSISETPPSIKSYSPPLFQSPSPPSDSPTTHTTHQAYHTHEFRVTPSDTKPASPPAVPARSFEVEPKVVDPKPQVGFSGLAEVQEESGGATATGTNGGGVKMRTLRANLSILNRSRRENMVRRTLLGFRISGFVFCLISFSVMAADKNQGWALDSYYRYKEFRYCLAVNVIGFVYSGLQTYDLTYFFTSGKHVMQLHLRHYFDFLMDQEVFALSLSRHFSDNYGDHSL
ncbi:CASP-like protein 4A1 isoform X3 [Prunus avium]|uniref:CASP-like protein n=1 Tax=Prunus avium TaxID=42229 RepID=A0A6P5SQP4_PRUAV|nr:CASP-like protein 4A1 isoform X3 [Prunus avium]XP_021816567.1 CASP-like protein 4A1 isoform X3 [Prunus avium]XP_021816639.1 CASP-like protein 4A1 isoform X3 [Prunus avium]